MIAGCLWLVFWRCLHKEGLAHGQMLRAGCAIAVPVRMPANMFAIDTRESFLVLRAVALIADCLYCMAPVAHLLFSGRGSMQLVPRDR